MTFHKEGYPSLIIVLTFSIFLIAVVHFFAPESSTLHYITYGFTAFLNVIILQFFRVPKRTITVNNNAIYAPADGKVVVIEKVAETEYFNDERIQVSIFMSPVNVHINFMPITGLVKYVKYHAGKYLVAWHPKSSTENERTTIVVEHANKQQLLMRQIAGALARRIVWYAKEGDQLNQCDQFGFIKFGSRVDVFLPLDAKINVELNQAVTGTQTIIAEFAQN